MNFKDSVSVKIPESVPFFYQSSIKLNKYLRELDSADLKKNMNLSDNLFVKVQKIISNFTGKTGNGRQAIFAYQGAVFKGIDVPSLSMTHLEFAQSYLRIISAQYGILRPYDLIEEYRLDFKTKFKTNKYNSLYDYWEIPFMEYFTNTETKNPILNLSSFEFSKAINFKKSKTRIIDIVFGEKHDNTYKSPPMYSKIARGKMAGYIIRNFITDSEKIKRFNLDGYKYNGTLSIDNKLIFTR